MTSLPWGLRCYRALTNLIAPLLPAYLRKRAQNGKEDGSRLDERFGEAPVARPQCILVWLHAASVGESLVALNVAGALRTARPDVSVLITTGTVTSANLIAKSTNEQLIHRYLPIDTPAATARFVQTWKPDLGIFIESELWPNLICAARRAGIPLALINGRMNAGSVRNWSRFRASARALLDGFAVLQAVDGLTAAALSDLADRDVGQTTNLKLAAGPPPVNKQELANLASALRDRLIWLAASTHPGEEDVALAAHGSLTMAGSNGLLILAPRHPNRSLEVLLAIKKAGLNVAQRSLGQLPTADTQVWLWDTLGELGLAFALSPVSLIGGSLFEGIGGHNPVEPAQLWSAIITGPYTASFADLFETLHAAGGARIIDPPSASALAVTVAGLWGDERARSAQCAAARNAVEKGTNALDGALDALLPLLPKRHA